MNEMNIYNTSKLITGKHGDIIIFNPKCIHYGYKNTTYKKRLNLYLTFNKKEDGDNYYTSRDDKKLVLENIGLDQIEKRMRCQQK